MRTSGRGKRRSHLSNTIPTPPLALGAGAATGVVLGLEPRVTLTMRLPSPLAAARRAGDAPHILLTDVRQRVTHVTGEQMVVTLWVVEQGTWTHVRMMGQSVVLKI